MTLGNVRCPAPELRVAFDIDDVLKARVCARDCLQVSIRHAYEAIECGRYGDAVIVALRLKVV
jgi:hypothetical protein